MRPPAYPRGSVQFAATNPSATRLSVPLPSSTADRQYPSATRPSSSSASSTAVRQNLPGSFNPRVSAPRTAVSQTLSPASLVVSSASEVLAGSAVGYSGFVPVVPGSGFPVGGWVSVVPDASLVVWRSAGCVWSPVSLTGYHSVSGAVVFHVPLIDPSLSLELLVRLVSLSLGSLGSLGLSEPLVATLVKMIRGI